MADHSRLSHDVTIARSSEIEQTIPRKGGPRAAEVETSDQVRLETSVEAQTILAEGGMAVIYRARDHGLQRQIAMKVLKPDSSDTVRRGFEREAQLMARLDHPGIVSVYGISAPDDPARIFTMKLVEGQTIAEIIDAGRPPRGRALVVMLRAVLRMCETLAYAHDRGVVHRDLKPENVMLGRYGECYIMDWGVALELDPKTGAAPELPPDKREEVIGTPAFMAPEQARGAIAEIDERTDIFGLGALLYYILTGQPPYLETTLTEVLDAAREGRTRAAELNACHFPVPARLSDIVARALAARREDRFQSAMELHHAIEQFLDTGEWFTRRVCQPGELIVREGQRGDRAFIVESGECEVFRGEGPREVSLRRIGPGEVIGELVLFSGATERTASIRAITKMSLLEVTREALEREMPAGSWTRQIIDTLARRFVAVDQGH